MLFFLTGDIETGKTRWLQALVAELENYGICACGVLAPGQWEEHANGGKKHVTGESGTTQNACEVNSQTATTYEKLGIDNVLLPQNERIVFAYRSDLLPQELEDTCTQAKRAQMRWLIQDSAIAEVNAHFQQLATNTPHDKAARLLVVDELGQLELLHDSGLSQAVALLDAGGTDQFGHAIVIVRDWLLDNALAHFANAPWDGMQAIKPTAESRAAVFAAFGAVP